jgi:hypothetical protein
VKHDLPSARLVTRPELRGAAGAIVLFETIAALYFAREILIPFAFALTLTFLLTPVVALLQRFHRGRVASVLTTLLAFEFAVSFERYQFRTMKSLHGLPPSISIMGVVHGVITKMGSRLWSTPKLSLRGRGSLGFQRCPRVRSGRARSGDAFLRCFGHRRPHA